MTATNRFMLGRTSTTWIAAVVVVLVGASPGLQSQAPIRTFAGSFASNAGESFTPLGDVDGDGTPDLAYTMIALTGAPSVRIISGATGSIYGTIGVPAGYAINSGFANSILGPGDITGDGIPDLIIGHQGAVPPTGGLRNGAVWAYDLATLLPAWQTFGQPQEYFSYMLGVMPDLNTDGFPEILATAPLDYTGPPTAVPLARILSGLTGAVLTTINSGWNSWGMGPLWGLSDVTNDGIADPWFGGGGAVTVYNGSTGAYLQGLGCPLSTGICGAGSGVVGVPDRDGDGIDEMVVGMPGIDWAGVDAGAVRVVSGSNFAVLGTVLGSIPNSFFGVHLATGGDFNGDGVDDIAVAATPQTGIIYVQVLSGIDFTCLATINDPQVGSRFADSIAFVGDIDLDGSDDLAIAAPFYSATPNNTYDGCVFVYSSRSVMAAEAGTVGVALGQSPVNVLSVNGGFGGVDRRVNIGLASPFTIGMTSPPSMVGPAPFALFGSIGVPNSVGAISTIIGDFAITPYLLSPSVPWLFVLADNFTPTGAPWIPSYPAPWTTSPLPGTTTLLQVTLQGVIQQLPTGAPFQQAYAITNAIQIVVP